MVIVVGSEGEESLGNRERDANDDERHRNGGRRHSISNHHNLTDSLFRTLQCAETEIILVKCFFLTTTDNESSNR